VTLACSYWIRKQDSPLHYIYTCRVRLLYSPLCNNELNKQHFFGGGGVGYRCQKTLHILWCVYRKYWSLVYLLFSSDFRPKICFACKVIIFHFVFYRYFSYQCICPVQRRWIESLSSVRDQQNYGKVNIMC